MSCIHIPEMHGHITLAPPTLTIKHGGESWQFETPPYCGLVVIGKSGNPIADPPKQSQFWRVVELWRDQGRRMGKDNICIYDEPPPGEMRTMVKISKRSLAYDDGRPDFAGLEKIAFMQHHPLSREGWKP